LAGIAACFAIYNERKDKRLIMSNATAITREMKAVSNQDKLIKHWLPIALIFWAVFNLLPFVAPVAMQSGWTGLGNTIYDVYGLFCHQMAHRSYFLFSEQIMYTPEQLPVELTGRMGTDALALRAFRGSETLGWKVAWSDRMVTMYGGFLLGGIAYWFISKRRQVQPMPIWLLILLVLPMGLDGGTHFISDFGGLTTGFRYTNTWLVNLTNNAFPVDFYFGDRLGSFNSWMRIITGLLFGIATAGFAFPFIAYSLKPKQLKYQQAK
jgi:uncharacterized membrane protein